MHLIGGGVLLGAVAVGLWALASGVESKSFAHFVKDFQSLLVGLLAVFLAIPPIFIGVQQLLETRKENVDRRRRKYRASKAFLPSSLSEITMYLEQTVIFIDIMRSHKGGSTPLVQTPPELSRDALPTISDCIENGDDNLSELLSRIMKLVQIFDARTRSAYDDINHGIKHPHSSHIRLVTDHSLNNYIRYATQIYAFTGRCFELARSSDTMELNLADATLEERTTALNIWGYDISTHPDLYDFKYS